MKINAHATNTNHNSHDEQANIQREISNRRNEQSLMNNTAPIVEQSNNVVKQTPQYKSFGSGLLSPVNPLNPCTNIIGSVFLYRVCLTTLLLCSTMGAVLSNK